MTTCPHGVSERLWCPACVEYTQAVTGAVADGKFGPRTSHAVQAFLRRQGYFDPRDADAPASELPTSPGTPPTIAERRAMIVDYARSWIGPCDPVTQVWPHVCPELARVEYRHTKSWCQGWALLIWKQTLPKCATWMFVHGKGFAGVYGVRTVPLPEAGDIAYWPALNGKPTHHMAIVERVVGGIVHTIDGNTTIAPDESVRPCSRSIVATDPVFYSASAYL